MFFLYASARDELGLYRRCKDALKRTGPLRPEAEPGWLQKLALLTRGELPGQPALQGLAGSCRFMAGHSKGKGGSDISASLLRRVPVFGVQVRYCWVAKTSEAARRGSCAAAPNRLPSDARTRLWLATLPASSRPAT
jgi:hypothetical protein